MPSVLSLPRSFVQKPSYFYFNTSPQAVQSVSGERILLPDVQTSPENAVSLQLCIARNASGLRKPLHLFSHQRFCPITSSYSPIFSFLLYRLSITRTSSPHPRVFGFNSRNTCFSVYSAAFSFIRSFRRLLSRRVIGIFPAARSTPAAFAATVAPAASEPPPAVQTSTFPSVLPS